MRFYLLLVTVLINFLEQPLMASEEEYEPSSSSYFSYGNPHFINNDFDHRFEDSYVTLERIDLAHIYKNKADELFTEALAFGTLYSTNASELYAQAGVYYSGIISAGNNDATQEIYQKVILSHFRAAFHLQNYSKDKAYTHFSECAALLYTYVTVFRLCALHQDYIVCKMLFNRMASFFEGLGNLNDEKTATNL